MKMRIKYMYEKGDSSYLNLLLEARSLLRAFKPGRVCFKDFGV